MILLTPLEQLKKRKEEVWKLWQVVDREENKLGDKLRSKEDSYFVSETTKRMLRYERKEKLDICKALWDYCETLDQQIKAIIDSSEAK